MLTGKVAIITGSGRGIGRATAEMMASAGALVVVNDLDESVARETVQVIKEKGGQALAVVGSVTEKNFPTRIIGETIKQFGQLDILVNNAGYTWDSLIHKMSDEQFQAMLDIHLIAPFRLIREAAPYMRDTAKQEMAAGQRVYRKIINVSSVVGTIGNIGQANYASAKAGIIGLTKTVAKEWGSFNINCNAVAYGLIDTRLTQSKEKGETVGDVAIGIPDKVRQIFEQSIPQGRAGTPEEAAAAILYLASPASDYMNGHVIQVNGGWYM